MKIEFLYAHHPVKVATVSVAGSDGAELAELTRKEDACVQVDTSENGFWSFPRTLYTGKAVQSQQPTR